MNLFELTKCKYLKENRYENAIIFNGIINVQIFRDNQPHPQFPIKYFNNFFPVYKSNNAFKENYEKMDKYYKYE